MPPPSRAVLVALVVALSAALLGCAASHARVDADASARVDAAGPADLGSPVFDADVCAPQEGTLTVSIVAVTHDVARCDFTSFDGAMLLDLRNEGVGPDTVVVSLDLCPLADADCRCDVRVTAPNFAHRFHGRAGHAFTTGVPVHGSVGPAHFGFAGAPSDAFPSGEVFYVVESEPATAPAAPVPAWFLTHPAFCTGGPAPCGWSRHAVSGMTSFGSIDDEVGVLRDTSFGCSETLRASSLLFVWLASPVNAG